MKNVAVSTEDGAFAVFSRPHPWEFAIQGKTEKGVGGGGGGGGVRTPHDMTWKLLTVCCALVNSSASASVA